MKRNTFTINENNREKINEWFESHQRRCRVRKMDYDKLVGAIKTIENTLRIPRSCMKGTKARIDLFSDHFANCYKGTPYSTVCYVECMGNYWKITSVQRVRCGLNINKRYELTLSENAVNSLIKKNSCF